MQLRYLAALLVLVSAPALAAPVTRTVYVTVTDGKGAPITDLTAADLAVKEGGKDREIVSVERAQKKMRLALAVEEKLVGDASVRLGIFEFIKRVADYAEVSLITISISNRTLVDYTADMNKLVDAINKLTLNPNPDSNVAEGVLEVARKFSADKPERPVLVVVALSGGQAGVDPRNVLNQVGESAMTMHSVTLAGNAGSAGVGSMNEEAGREQVLGDGPKQSGGRRVDITVTAAVPKALQQVADDLLSQYVVTYTLPDGVKPNKRFNVSTKRKGVTLRAPTTIPEK